MAPVNVLAALRAARSDARRNASLLDHISAPHRATAASNAHAKHPPSPPARSMTPVSRRILSHLFAALDKPSQQAPNYLFVDTDHEHHFLYALVLPLIARLMAVSCPGLVCIVELPRPEAVADSHVSPYYDGYGSNGSNGSNGSKSAAPTTPSPHDTSRTPSPSDHAVQPHHKSLTPDCPLPSHLIRHSNEPPVPPPPPSSHPPNPDFQSGDSPPPDPLVSDHRALRLVCNGFEVLTGKMPPPRYDMGNFTLASVSWDKAAIMEPQGKGVSLAFSNGMVSPTDGIAVTFSNGSLVVLTLLDALTTLESAHLSDATPVIIFSFASPNRPTLGEYLSSPNSSDDADTAQIRAQLKRPNCFFAEFGYQGSPLSSESDSPLDNFPLCTDRTSAQANERHIPCPPLLMSAVPRAVPLFVNTINQAYVDGIYYDVPSGASTSQGYSTQPTNASEALPANKHAAASAPLSAAQPTQAVSQAAPQEVPSAPQEVPSAPAPIPASTNQATHVQGPQPHTSTGITEKPEVPVAATSQAQTAPVNGVAHPSVYNRRPWDSGPPPNGAYDYYGYAYGGRGHARPPPMPPHPGYFMHHQPHPYYGYNGYYMNGWGHDETRRHMPPSYGAPGSRSTYPPHGYYGNDAYHAAPHHVTPNGNMPKRENERQSERQPPPGGGSEAPPQRQEATKRNTTEDGRTEKGGKSGSNEMDREALQALLGIRDASQHRTTSSTSTSSSKRARHML